MRFNLNGNKLTIEVDLNMAGLRESKSGKSTILAEHKGALKIATLNGQVIAMSAPLVYRYAKAS